MQMLSKKSLSFHADMAHDATHTHVPCGNDSSETGDVSFSHRRLSRRPNPLLRDDALPQMETEPCAEQPITKQRRRRFSPAAHPQDNSTDEEDTDDGLFCRLQKENARLPPQDSTSFILAQIERQNTLLEKDPKSICIQSNELRAHFSTVQRLVTDNLTPTSATFSSDVHDADDEEEDDDENDDGGRDADNEDDQEEAIHWDLWEAIVQDFDRVALKMPHLLSIKLRAGIPIRLRGLIWQAMCKSASLHLETVYGQLCCERSPHERVIQRDLARTFPSIDMFKQENGAGQTAMRRILEAYSLYDTEVGYCQGLAFLVGPLLMNMPETQAFCVFVRLMETYGMRTMFTLSMEGLQLRLYQFSSLLSEELPEIADHMEKHAVHAAMYASQWFLTLFAYAFPIGLVTHIYDIIFAEGAAETIMRIAIAMLKRSQTHILMTDEFEDLLDLVTSRKLCEPYVDEFRDVIRDAMALSGLITRQRLDDLAERYEEEGGQDKECAEQVLANRFGFFWRQRSIKQKKKPSHRPFSTTQSTPCPAVDTRSSISFPLTFSSSPQSSRSTEDTSQATIALERLEQAHRRTMDELFELKMDKQDVESERNALKITIMELERRYSSKSVESKADIPCQCQSPSTYEDLGLKEDVESNHSSHSSQGDHFSSSDATAVSTVASSSTLQAYQAEDDEGQDPDPGEDLHAELVKIKVANFELQQQCEQLKQELDDVQGRYDMVHEGQMVLVDKLMVMKSDMDVVMNQKNQRDLEWLELTQENARLRATQAHKEIHAPERKPIRRRGSTGGGHYHASSQSAHARIRELEILLAQATARQKQEAEASHGEPAEKSSDTNKETKGSSMTRSSSLYGRVWSAISPRYSSTSAASVTVTTHS